MTLIAAFRCNGGAVICADTQETVGDYRVAVDKIAPREVGEYQVVIGGSGNVAGLIDGFDETLSIAIEDWPASLDEREIRENIHGVLQDYHRNDVANDPAEPDAKRLSFIICVKGKDSENVFLWRTDGASLVRVSDHTLLGWEEPLYDHEVRWLYQQGVSTAQAVLLGVRLLTMAKDTSNYVGGDTQVIVIAENGMQLLHVENVRLLEERVRAFNQALAHLVLACPDTSINSSSFKELLGGFEEHVLHLREHYMERSAVSMLARALSDPCSKGEKYADIPLGTTIYVSPEGHATVREPPTKTHQDED